MASNWRGSILDRLKKQERTCGEHGGEKVFLEIAKEEGIL